MLRQRNHRNRLLISIFLLVSILLALTSVMNRKEHSLTPNIISQTIILIRTSNRCQTRLTYLLQSWLSSSLAQQSKIYLFTDRIKKYTDKRVLKSFKTIIETNCSETHGRFDLCCKTAHEFDFYYHLSRTNPDIEWMCRFDDDQYVNLENLYKFLPQFDPFSPYYIGRTSLNHRLKTRNHSQTFTFATYGAGVCFSRSLLARLRPYVSKTIFPHNCIKQRLSDDAYVGFLTEVILNVTLTSFQELFHSHLEKLDMSFRQFSFAYLRRAITFGFAWDRYDLSWLPIIHQLIELIHKGEQQAAERLWLFLRNYEKEHPNRSEYKRDQTCLPSQTERH
ncbi:unnamed protein product [Adineta ricciae]|uniref:Fringe-like glycosyltransferase domain-containing protein n=1 Tax=Adineta ricciae TaxID=249248 RepID=A0A813S6K9_ADIRI|nr:unnamed protein product [Adineta ricciae]CAF1382997.1 unnamed protein product [Adineta ricciae]